MINNDRKKALEAALSQIDKQFGKGSAMKYGDRPSMDIEVVSSGSLALDIALGVGGYPRGRVIEIYGPESSGKTTLTLHAIAEAQRAGLSCAFIDAEHAFDPAYAKNLKINLEGGMADNQMGLQARLMSKALRKLTSTISKTNATVFFINQIRMKIGVMFGNPETTSGGNALKFYASVRLDIRRGNAIKEQEEVLGNETKVKVVKNKVAPPFKTAEFEIIYGEGVSKIGEIIDLGVKFEILEKSGSWYAFNGTKIGQGKENTKNYLKENPKIAEEIEILVRKKASAVIAGEKITSQKIDGENTKDEGKSSKKKQATT